MTRAVVPDATAPAVVPDATAPAVVPDATAPAVVPDLCDDAHGIIDASTGATATDGISGIIGTIVPIDANSADATEKGHVPFHFAVLAGMPDGISRDSRLAEVEGTASEDSAWHGQLTSKAHETMGLLAYLGWSSGTIPTATTVEALPTLRTLRTLLSTRTAAVCGTRIALPAAPAGKASKASKPTVPAGTDEAVARASRDKARAFGKATA